MPLICIILNIFIPLYKTVKRLVWRYNHAKFGVSMYNSVREKCQTNLLVKKKEEIKKETGKDLLQSKSVCLQKL